MQHSKRERAAALWKLLYTGLSQQLCAPVHAAVLVSLSTGAATAPECSILLVCMRRSLGLHACMVHGQWVKLALLKRLACM